MPTHEAEAIVLRQYSLADADRIIVFVTREYGKIRAVGRGVKKTKSRLAACLEPLNHIRLRFYAKEGADLCRILQCETVHTYLGKTPSLEQIYGFSYFAEIIQEFVEENNPNPLFFRLFLAVLNTGETQGIGEALIRYFEFWTLKLSGLLPNYDSCSKCGKYVKDDGFYAWIESGEGRCRSCGGNKGVWIQPAAAETLRRLAEPPERFVRLELPEPAGRDLERLAQKLLELHLERRLKSYPALREMLRGR